MLDRFMDKVSPEPNSGCWLWTGAVNDSGYGLFRNNERAHRVSYEIHKGPIPNGLVACHKCDNRLCVNPDHIFIGTKGDNNRDMHAKGRANRPRGEANHSRLSGEQVEFVLLSQLGTRQLGRLLGVSHTCISRIRRGLRWKHVSR